MLCVLASLLAPTIYCNMAYNQFMQPELSLITPNLHILFSLDFHRQLQIYMHANYYHNFYELCPISANLLAAPPFLQGHASGVPGLASQGICFLLQLMGKTAWRNFYILPLIFSNDTVK
jgi:hypothetical protein